MKKQIFLGIFLLLVFINLVNALDCNYSDYNESIAEYYISDACVKYDKGISNKFLYEDRVYVTITLKDNSGITYSGTKEERFEQLKLQDEWFQNKINEIIKTFDETDFILYREMPKGFSGLISKEGFEKFKQMQDIDAIELPSGGNSSSIVNVFHLKWFVYVLLFLVIIFLFFLFYLRKRRRSNYAKTN